MNEGLIVTIFWFVVWTIVLIGLGWIGHEAMKTPNYPEEKRSAKEILREANDHIDQVRRSIGHD